MSDRRLLETLHHVIRERDKLRDRIAELEKAGDAMAFTDPPTDAMMAWRKLRREKP